VLKEYFMKISETQAKAILEEGSYKFTLLGLNMLISKLSRVYSSNPSSETLTNCTSEINTFISKYAAVMKHDYSLIIQAGGTTC
jgi:hypothetical protein